MSASAFVHPVTVVGWSSHAPHDKEQIEEIGWPAKINSHPRTSKAKAQSTKPNEFKVESSSKHSDESVDVNSTPDNPDKLLHE